MRFKGKMKWVLLVVVLVAGVIAFRVLSGGKQEMKAGQPLTSVRVERVQKMVKQGKFEYAGSLEAGQQATISAKNGGKVASIYVEDGEKVAKGQKLLQLDNIELRNALLISSAMLQKSEVALATAVSNYDRFKQLYDAGGMTEKDFEDAGTAVKIAQSDVDMARASVSNAREALANTTVTSPIGGIISGKNVNLGQVLAPGQAVMSVQSTGKMYCVVNVKQEEAGVINRGANALVTVDSFPGKKFSGVVESINAVVDVDSRTFKTKISLDNKNMVLKPGMYANAVILTGNDVKVTAVPMNAVTGEEGLYYVFVDANGKAKRVPIMIGDVMDKYVEIKSGLKGGEEIIVTNVSSLKEGDRLEVKQR